MDLNMHFFNTKINDKKPCPRRGASQFQLQLAPMLSVIIT